MANKKKINGTRNAIFDLLNGIPIIKVVRQYGYRINPIDEDTDVIAVRIRKAPPRHGQDARQGACSSASLPAEVVVFWHSSEEARLQAFEREGDTTYKEYCENHCVPGEDLHQLCLEEIERDKLIYSQFFGDLVARRQINIVLFGYIEKYHRHLCRVLPAYDPFHVKHQLAFLPYTRTVQDWLELAYIIQPAFTAEDSMFEMSRVCKQCGDFFVAKTKKTEFCSPSCRVQSYGGG